MSIIDDHIKALEKIEREFGSLSGPTQKTLDLLRQVRKKEAETEARLKTYQPKEYVYDLHGENPVGLQELCQALALRGHIVVASYLDPTKRYVELRVSRELTEADITVLRLAGRDVRPSIINYLPNRHFYG